MWMIGDRAMTPEEVEARIETHEEPNMSERIEVLQRCPTCESPSPELHPAMQYEGEVEICKDAWHSVPPPARDWKPGERVRIIIDGVIHRIGEEGFAWVKVEDGVYYQVPLSSIHPMTEKRIASLEAERDKAVELLKEPCLCGEENDHRDSMGAWICKPCFDKQKFLASIGGEVKNGQLDDD